jgi:hypothetical protein
MGKKQIFLVLKKEINKLICTYSRSFLPNKKVPTIKGVQDDLLKYLNL